MHVPRHIRLGSRGSALALWQTEHVATRLQAAYPDLTIETVVVHTEGDRTLATPLPLIGGKGLFTLELENALREGRIDGAVHSLKDLPTDDPLGLTLAAIPPRGDVADVMIIRAGQTETTGASENPTPLWPLPFAAAVGTSSRRRAAQLLAQRPDLQILDIRGNVDTRIHKALDPDGPYDAIVLAAAGLKRLGLDRFISGFGVLPGLPPDKIRGQAQCETLSLEQMLPAAGQGALALQCRQEAVWLDLFARINDPDTRAAVTAERSFLAGLNGGCSLPVAALAALQKGRIRLQGRINSLDGSRQIDVQMTGPDSEAEQLGRSLAQLALDKGAQEILDSIQN